MCAELEYIACTFWLNFFCGHGGSKLIIPACFSANLWWKKLQTDRKKVRWEIFCVTLKFGSWPMKNIGMFWDTYRNTHSSIGCRSTWASLTPRWAETKIPIFFIGQLPNFKVTQKISQWIFFRLVWSFFHHKLAGKHACIICFDTTCPQKKLNPKVHYI